MIQFSHLNTREWDSDSDTKWLMPFTVEVETTEGRGRFITTVLAGHQLSLGIFTHKKE